MAKKPDEETIKEMVETQSSGNIKRMKDAQFDMDVMLLSKMTDLQEIKRFLERKIIEFGKHPADFQNIIEYYANNISKEKDCKGTYSSFVLDTRGIVWPESFWSKLGKKFRAENYSFALAILFFLAAIAYRWLFPVFYATTESAILLQSISQSSLLAGIFFLLAAIYFKIGR